MKISRLPKRILFGALVSLAAFIGTGGLAYAQEQQSGVPVQIVVTAMPRSKAPATKLTPQNLMVSQGHYTNQIVSVESAQGSQAGVQLLLLIDDSDRTTAFATQLNDLRSFISNQPPNVMIGVAYMFNGAVKMYQDFTTDHSAAAQTVRLPGGLAVGSDPYDSLTDVIQHWPTAANSRRAILMISNGIDPYGTGDAQDPNIKQVIRRAQIAGIQVFTIYTGSERIGRGLFPGAAYWGSVYLQMLSEQTGAEAYNSGLGPPVSYSPFLDNLGFSLQHQYLVTILVHPGKKPGMQKIKVKSGADVKLRAPSEVFVPAAAN